MHRLRLTDGDVQMLLEALDAYLPYPEGDARWPQLSSVEILRWVPFRLLRFRLRNPKSGGVLYSLRGRP